MKNKVINLFNKQEIVLPNTDKAATALPVQTITKLFGANIKFGIVPLWPPLSPIRQPCKLTGEVLIFFNSIHSLFGRPICGLGSAMISSITISYRVWAERTCVSRNDKHSNRKNFIFPNVLNDFYKKERRLFGVNTLLTYFCASMITMKHTKRTKKHSWGRFAVLCM